MVSKVDTVRFSVAIECVNCDTVTGPVWPRVWVEVQFYSSMTAALEVGE